MTKSLTRIVAKLQRPDKSVHLAEIIVLQPRLIPLYRNYLIFGRI